MVFLHIRIKIKRKECAKSLSDTFLSEVLYSFFTGG